MKWWATLKWEAIADFKHLRRIVFPTLGVWGLMMILSLFVPPGINVLWLMYLPIAFAGIYMGGFYPSISTGGYIKRRRIMETQSDRSVCVFAIIRLLYNIVVSAAGFSLLYIGSIALRRLEITWIDFLQYLLMLDNVFHEFSYGRLLFLVYMLAVLVPAWGLLWDASFCSANRRWGVVALGLGLFPFFLLVMGAIFITPEAGFFVHENPFFAGGQIGTVEALILSGLAISPIVSIMLISWLIDKKTDFMM